MPVLFFSIASSMPKLDGMFFQKQQTSSNNSTKLPKPRQNFISDKNASICVVMLYTKEIESYSRLSHEVNQMYCRDHEYDLIVFRRRLSHKQDRAVQWDKVRAVSVIMNENQDKYKYVMWIDSDAVFQDHKKKIEDVIAMAPDTAELLFSSDVPNIHPRRLGIKPKSYRWINTGAFIVKNTPWAREFMTWWWDNPQEFRFEKLHEQAVVTRAANPVSMAPKHIYVPTFHHSVEKIHVFDAQVMNSVFGKPFNDTTWIMHLMQRSTPIRVRHFTRVKNKVEKGRTLLSDMRANMEVSSQSIITNETIEAGAVIIFSISVLVVLVIFVTFILRNRKSNKVVFRTNEKGEIISFHEYVPK